MKNQLSFSQGLVVGGFVAIFVCAVILLAWKKFGPPEFEDGTHVVLVKGGKETSFKITYDLSKQAPQAVLSPDKKKILYAIWQNIGYSFYVADVDDSVLTEISRQHVGEGSGTVDLGSMGWSADGESIHYSEAGDSGTVLYEINIETLEETREVRTE